MVGGKVCDFEERVVDKDVEVIYDVNVKVYGNFGVVMCLFLFVDGVIIVMKFWKFKYLESL